MFLFLLPIFQNFHFIVRRYDSLMIANVDVFVGI